MIAIGAVAACTTTGQDTELAQIQRSNAAEATAQAANISKETDPDSRAAQCIVFLGLSRHHKGAQSAMTMPR
jgi:hypothetical protein